MLRWRIWAMRLTSSSHGTISFLIATRMSRQVPLEGVRTPASCALYQRHAWGVAFDAHGNVLVDHPKGAAPDGLQKLEVVIVDFAAGDVVAREPAGRFPPPTRARASVASVNDGGRDHRGGLAGVVDTAGRPHVASCLLPLGHQLQHPHPRIELCTSGTPTRRVRARNREGNPRARPARTRLMPMADSSSGVRR